MSPLPSAPYVCAVCHAPVAAGGRFCAHCGTPFSERPPLRVAASPPPVAYDAPPPERNTAALWVGGVVVLFVSALVGAYLLFAQPSDRREADVSGEIAEAPPVEAEEAAPPASVEERLDEVFSELDETAESLEGALADEPVVDAPGEGEVAVPDSDDPSGALLSAWSAYESALAAYRQAVQSAGSADPARPEVADACRRLAEAGETVLRLPGREQFASQIARDGRDC